MLRQPLWDVTAAGGRFTHRPVPSPSLELASAHQHIRIQTSVRKKKKRGLNLFSSLRAKSVRKLPGGKALEEGIAAQLGAVRKR